MKYYNKILAAFIGNLWQLPQGQRFHKTDTYRSQKPHFKAHEEDKMETPWKNQCAVELIRMLQIQWMNSCAPINFSQLENVLRKM